MISLAYQNTVSSPFRRYAWKTRSTAATVVCRWYTPRIFGYRAAGERSARQRYLAKPDPGSSSAAGIGRYRPASEDWHDISWNPIAGCSAVSRDCDNCWAMRVAAPTRLALHWANQDRADGSRLDRRNSRSRRIVDLAAVPPAAAPYRVSLMSDLFHEALTTATIDLVHAVIAVAHWRTFLVLTKRSRRMREYYGNPETPRRVAEEIDRLSSEILPSGRSASSAAAGTVALSIPTSTRRSGRGRTVSTPRHWIVGFSRVTYGTPSATPAAIRPVGLKQWPLPNLWPGVSVEDQRRIENIGDCSKRQLRTLGLL
jgi:protein gp37